MTSDLSESRAPRLERQKLFGPFHDVTTEFDCI
jgi:hypothetical protein